MGFGGSNTLPDLRLRGVALTAVNPVQDAIDTSLINFDDIASAGDSGGPIIRYNADRNRDELVGFILGTDGANEMAHVDPSGTIRGNFQVTVGTTITQAAFDQLLAGANRWRSGAITFSQPYPRPNDTYPNGQPNPLATNFPHNYPQNNGSAGPSVPLRSGGDGTTTNGYFVGSWPLPTPTPQPPSVGSDCMQPIANEGTLDQRRRRRFRLRLEQCATTRTACASKSSASFWVRRTTPTPSSRSIPMALGKAAYPSR